jgi:BON domain
MNSLRTLLAGAGLGGSAVFLLDPERGRRRRALLGDQAAHMAHSLSKAAGKISRDAANRGEGFRAELDSSLRYEQPTDDQTAERVRARLGRLVRHPGSIDVTVEDGCVTLTGPVLAGEAPRLLASVHSIQGVISVESALDIHEEAGHEPGFQGNPAPKPVEIEFLQQHWSPTARLMAGAIGAGLAAYGTTRRGVFGALSGVGGLTLLARALADVSLTRLFGIDAGPRAVDIQKTIEIEAPVDRVFDLFSNVEDLRFFMPQFKSVLEHGKTTAHVETLTLDELAALVPNAS